MEVQLATIADGRKLAAQKVWRRTVLRGRSRGIDDPDASARSERWSEVVKQPVRLRDFVIHVHQDRDVERTDRQSRIVRLAKRQGDIAQIEIAHPLAAPQVF